jgi:hypothetical protein
MAMTEFEINLLAALDNLKNALNDLNKNLSDIRDNTFGSSQALHKVSDAIDFIADRVTP